jgi:hypothetical protein
MPEQARMFPNYTLGPEKWQVAGIKSYFAGEWNLFTSFPVLFFYITSL